MFVWTIGETIIIDQDEWKILWWYWALEDHTDWVPLSPLALIHAIAQWEGPLFAMICKSPHFDFWCSSRQMQCQITTSPHCYWKWQILNVHQSKCCYLWTVSNKLILRISCWLISPRLITCKEDWFYEVQSDRCLSYRENFETFEKLGFS